MNRYIKILILFLGLGGVISSCTNEQDSIFDESSAVRLEAAKKEAVEYLTSSPNGWMMEYFPNAESAGVIFLVRFDPNGSCVIGAKHAYQTTFATQTSLFEMIADNGPVLTFNTYNDLFHIFSYPSLPGAAESDGKGLEGDYEFIVLQKEATYAWLKGKKHGAYIRMTPLAEGQDWEEIYNQIDAMSKRLFSKEKLLPLLHYKGTELERAYDGNSSIFNIVPDGKDVQEGEPLPFILLPDGLRIVSTSTDISGKMYVPNQENTRLSCTVNGETDYFTGPVMNQFFLEKTTYLWKSDTTAYGENVKAILAQIRNKLLSPSIYKGQMKLLSIDFGPAVFQGKPTNALICRFKYGKDEYFVPIKMNLSISGADQVVIDFPQPLDYSGNTIGAAFIKLGFNEFLLLPDALKGTYTISSKNSFLLTDVTLSGNGTISLVR